MLLLPCAALAAPIPVSIVETDAGWGLLRGGAPFALRGAGGHQDLPLLRAIGGTAIRTWGTGPETADILDEAHANGLAVSVGIWLGHPRHGFDYADPAQVSAQKEAVREAVLAHRDHPAVLMWGLGNEMEGFEDGSDPAVWAAVCDAAALIQELDPHHPVMTTTADIGGGRVPAVDACEHVDIHGINSYGGAASVAERYTAAGGRKPVILTEYGPPGTWEIPTDAHGAPPEPSSTEKAGAYARIARDVVSDERIIGGFAFLWGWKMEATATWFGLFLPDGTRLGGVDALAEVWGSPVPNRAPTAGAIDAPARIAPGAPLRASWDVIDPDGDPLAVTWTLRPEMAVYLTGGDAQATPPAVAAAEGARAALEAPRSPGLYRLYAEARDGHGGGAAASAVIQVGPPTGQGGPVPMPWWLYRNAGEGGPWAPTGWMGDTDAIGVDTDWREGCASPPSCVRVENRDTDWTGVAWQFPSNDWGQLPDAVDLSGARWVRLKVRAEGLQPIPNVKLGVGLIRADQPHPDSLRVEQVVTVGAEWQEVWIRLRGDRRAVKTGLWWVLPVQARPGTVFYIDDVVFVSRRMWGHGSDL